MNLVLYCSGDSELVGFFSFSWRVGGVYSRVTSKEEEHRVEKFLQHPRQSHMLGPCESMPSHLLHSES